MPQWAGSCWYYLRFTDPKNSNEIFSKEAASWLPVDLYVGGQEHAVLHLLYARFWHKVLYDLKIVDHPEPFSSLVHQGMILGMDGEKMSKSRGNVINPDDVVVEHGADVLRLYEMFMGPLEATKPWQTAQVAGVRRFRDRVYAITQAGPYTDECPEAVLKEMHRTIKKVTEDIEELKYNTAISSLMILVNAMEKEDHIPYPSVSWRRLWIARFPSPPINACSFRPECRYVNCFLHHFDPDCIRFRQSLPLLRPYDLLLVLLWIQKTLFSML